MNKKTSTVARIPMAKPNGYQSLSSTYDGQELKPFDGRPGAMDAYRLPSLVNGRREVRK